MSSQLPWITDVLQQLSDEHLFRERREVRPLPEGRCLVDGQEAWDFASNDYLGLSADPRLIAAATAALQTHGVGARASQLVSGRTDLHAKLERDLAAFEGTEAAILFPTGLAANVGAVAALASQGDSVFCDRLNHASLVDGCRLSGARLRVYRHDDLTGLRRALNRELARRKFIVTDAVFSMDGDLAPLVELCDIAESENAVMIVDEAHGTGVFGTEGKGVCELLNVEHRVAVRIGTLSKAIGALGGFVAGSQSLVDFLWNKARTQVYSTALPPALCAAASAAVGIVQSEPLRRQRLLKLADTFRESLLAQGVTPLTGSVGPIVPIVLHDPQAAVCMAQQLLDRGFFVGAIRPPTVPQGTSRLRISLHSTLADDLVGSLAREIGHLVATAKVQQC